MSNQPPSILIVGSMAFDDLELPTTNAKNVVGGAATYAAYSASLFASVGIVAVVGQDFPDGDLDSLARRGVNLAGVERAAGKTFRWAGRYDANLTSRVTLDTQLNVFADFRPKLPKAYHDCPYVLLGNIQPELQLEVLDQLKAPKLVVADTMNYWIEGHPEMLGKVLARVDVLVINDEEARLLSGHHNIVRAAREIRSRGPRTLVIKRGEYGALLFDGTSTFFAPAYPLEEVVDPTGAGDTFAGGFIGHLARTGDTSPDAMRRAIMVGSAAASFCVEAVGTAKIARVSTDDVSHRLEAFRALMHLPVD